LSASILIYGEQFRTVSYRESNRLHTNERPASLFVVPSELRRTAVRNLVPSYILHCRRRQQVPLTGWYICTRLYVVMPPDTTIRCLYIVRASVQTIMSVSFCLLYTSGRSALIGFVTSVLSVQTWEPLQGLSGRLDNAKFGNTLRILN